ncbi:hypothetical protein B9Z55_010535 [Caenorhabditis nigoni]|uniref:Uncharacterized protein n=1 Tax=Caenorhabditis nigoni TaxID=1611254 RepID=A0A2G5UH41_9PELO|nr:hypothetical protein B9Z55_010535 [Caenorhabditis nigoni]
MFLVNRFDNWGMSHPFNVNFGFLFFLHYRLPKLMRKPPKLRPHGRFHQKFPRENAAPQREAKRTRRVPSDDKATWSSFGKQESTHSFNRPAFSS